MRHIVIGGKRRERSHGLWLSLAVNTLALYLTATIVPGVTINGLWGAALAAVVLAAANTFIRPLLIVLTLPLTLFTLGFFLLIVNGLTLLFVAWVTGDALQIAGLGSAVLAWLVFWIANWLLSGVLTPGSSRRAD